MVFSNIFLEIFDYQDFDLTGDQFEAPKYQFMPVNSSVDPPKLDVVLTLITLGNSYGIISFIKLNSFFILIFVDDLNGLSLNFFCYYQCQSRVDSCSKPASKIDSTNSTRKITHISLKLSNSQLMNQWSFGRLVHFQVQIVTRGSSLERTVNNSISRKARLHKTKTQIQVCSALTIVLYFHSSLL